VVQERKQLAYMWRLCGKLRGVLDLNLFVVSCFFRSPIELSLCFFCVDQIEHGFEIQPQCRVGLSNRALRVASLVRAPHSTSKHYPLFLHALYDSADDELCMHRDRRREGCSPSFSN
jgi:hypothetical protein